MKQLLTKRETEFVKLCCTDMDYQEIANTMCISRRSIGTFTERIFKKWNVNTRHAIMLRAFKYEIVKVQDISIPEPETELSNS